MSKIKKMYSDWKQLELKCNLSGHKALAAVEQDGYALRYVKEHIFKVKVGEEQEE